MRRIVCKGYAGCWEGIFYTQAASRGYLKLLAFFLIWQKKTTVFELSFNGLSPLRQKPNYFYPPPLPHKQESIFLKPVF